MSDTKPFWLVWQPESGSPSIRHETKQAAITEAERLARAHAGRRFYVLAADHFIIKDELQHVLLGDGVIAKTAHEPVCFDCSGRGLNGAGSRCSACMGSGKPR